MLRLRVINQHYFLVIFNLYPFAGVYVWRDEGYIFVRKV